MINFEEEYIHENGYLTGKLLIAMPFQQDPRFHQAVIYICGHDESGAMGIVINKPLVSVSFKELLLQMEVDVSSQSPNLPVHYGGPIEIGRGFVLHSADYLADSSVIISGNFALTATIEILRAISQNRGPDKAMLALGYVGWSAYQLENELQNNDWLVIDASPEIVFNTDLESTWRTALASIGVKPANITLDSGHA